MGTFCAPRASAQFANWNGLSPYTQNFDGLPGATGGTSSATLANTNGPFALNAAPIGGTNVDGWYVARQPVGPQSAAAQFFVTDGNTGTTVGIAVSAGGLNSPDRALGTASTTNAVMRFGGLIQNTSANNYGSLTLTFDFEQWRNGGGNVANNTPFSYAIVSGAATATTSLNDTAVTFTNVAAGALTSKVTGATAGQLDGNADANRTAGKTVTLNNIVFGKNDVLILRWDDTNEQGADDILAIDNVSLTGTITTSRNLFYIGDVAGAWNTDANNKVWSENNSGTTGFQTNDFTTFGTQSLIKTVTVDAAGVTTASMSVTNTDANGAYVFTGGKITGPLTKSGAGRVVFQSPNAFTAVTLSAGTIESQATGSLGAAPVTVTGASTLKFTGATQSFTNAVAVNAPLTVDTDVALTVGGGFSGAGGLTFTNNSASPLLFGDLGGYTGAINVTKGTMRTSTTADGDMFSSATVLTIAAGATVEMVGQGDSFASLAGAGKIDVGTTTASSFLNITGAQANTFSGVIAGTTGNANGLGITGGGTMTLSGLSTFVAPTTITNGRIILGADVLPNLPGPLGSSNLAITLNPGAGTANNTSIRVDGDHAVNRPITIVGNTNASVISIGSTNDNNVTFAGDITLTAAGTNVAKLLQLSNPVSTAGKVLTFSGAIKSDANGASMGVEKVNTGVVVLSGASTYAGPTVVTDGTLRITGSIAGSSGVTVADGKVLEIGSTQLLKGLTTNGAAQVRFTPGGPLKVLTVGDGSGVGTISASPTGTVDLGSNAVVVDYAVGSEAQAIQSVRALIVKGYNATAAMNDGNWKGTGITSTVAQADGSRAVGYAQASEVRVNGQALGQPVDSTAIITRLTLAGDATLDGVVDFNDLVRLAQNYNQPVSAAGDSWWFNGDFTYDGVTDFNDLVKLAQNYNSALPSEAIPGATAGFEADLAAAFAQVPEPATIAWVGVGAVAALARRRRR